MATYNVPFNENSGSTDSGSTQGLLVRPTEESGSVDTFVGEERTAQVRTIDDNSGTTDNGYSQGRRAQDTSSSGVTDSLSSVEDATAPQRTFNENSGTTDNGDFVGLAGSTTENSGNIDTFSFLKSEALEQGSFSDNSGVTDFGQSTAIVWADGFTENNTNTDQIVIRQSIFISGSDSGAITITDAGTVNGPPASQGDGGSLGVIETVSLFKAISVADTLPITLSDFGIQGDSPVKIGVESIGITVTETSQLVRAFTGQDQSAISVSEVVFNNTPLQKSASDSGSISVADGASTTAPSVNLPRGLIQASVRDKPVGLWGLGSTDTFIDFSGYNKVASMSTGTAGTTTGLGNGFSYSSIYGNTAVAQFDTTVFAQGKESQQFSLEALVRVITRASGTNAEQQLLSHLNTYDGLVVNGTVVSFVTKYTSTGEARASYDIQIPRKVHVVGVHTGTKNSLYVDGVLVAEAVISDAQQADTYVTSNGKLYSGLSTSATQKIAVNNAAVYARALPESSIAAHYREANKNVTGPGVAPAFGGTRIPLAANDADLFVKRSWSSTADWRSGDLNNVSVEQSRLRPLQVNGVSVAGTWTDNVSLDIANTSSIYGVNMQWDGQGVVVEASVDGTSWVAVTRGVNISNISPGFNPTGKELYVRVTFSGGVSGDTSFLDDLTVYGYKTGTIPVIDSRTVTATSPLYIQTDREPGDLRDDWGALIAGGTLVVSADTSTGTVAPKTVEMWLKKTTATNPTFSANLNAADANYVNAISSTTMPDGEWVLRHFVVNAGVSAQITISGNVHVGHIVFYEDILSPADIKAVYDSYIGLVSTLAEDSSTIFLTRTIPAVSIYAHDWSITTAG